MRITTFGKTFAARAYVRAHAVGRRTVRGERDPRGSISGTVRVTAPGRLGRRYVAPVLMQLMEEQPGIMIKHAPVGYAVVRRRRPDDIGVHAGFITDGRFIARRVGALSIHTVSAPQLFDTTGVPKSVDALPGMPLTALNERSTRRAWPWTFRHNHQLDPPLPALVTDDPEIEVLGCTHARVTFPKDALRPSSLNAGMLATATRPLADHRNPWVQQVRGGSERLRRTRETAGPYGPVPTCQLYRRTIHLPYKRAGRINCHIIIWKMTSPTSSA